MFGSRVDGVSQELTKRVSAFGPFKARASISEEDGIDVVVWTRGKDWRSELHAWREFVKWPECTRDGAIIEACDRAIDGLRSCL